MKKNYKTNQTSHKPNPPEFTATNIGDAFEDVHNPEIEGCAEGNPLVSRNLARLAAILNFLAERIAQADTHLDTPNILGVALLLQHYKTELPTLLKDQLDAAYSWLPLGMIEDDSLVQAITPILYATPANQK